MGQRSIIKLKYSSWGKGRNPDLWDKKACLDIETAAKNLPNENWGLDLVLRNRAGHRLRISGSGEKTRLGDKEVCLDIETAAKKPT